MHHRLLRKNDGWFPNQAKPGQGFTLMELLITIALLGLLAVAIIIIINPLTYLQKARDARRKSDLAQIQRALELYYNDHGRYPPGFYDDSMEPAIPHHCYICPLIGACSASQAVKWGQSFTPYLATVPEDPFNASSDRFYQYWSSVDGQVYRLWASLERANDPQICPGTCHMPASDVYCGAGNKKCNYEVTSPNVSP